MCAMFGGIRFLDFAIVTTHLGAMVEPFLVADKTQVSQQFVRDDTNCMIRRIDEMANCSSDNILNFGNSYKLHEGMGLRVGP